MFICRSPLPRRSTSAAWCAGWSTVTRDANTPARELTEDQLVAEGDKSNGVLLSSGYIAGGTLAGVLFAFLAIPMKDRLDAFEKWATAHNPFFEGPSSDLLAMIPFVVLCLLLYLVGRDVLLASRKRKA